MQPFALVTVEFFLCRGGAVAVATDSQLATGRSAATLRLPMAELIVLAGIVVFGTNVLEVSLRGGPMEPFVGYTFSVFYLTFFTLLFITGAVPKALLHNPILAILLLLPLLSIFWSVDPATSRLRIFLLFGTTAFGLFIGWHYDRARLIRLLAVGVTLNMMLSMALIVAMPSIGIDQTEAWGGTWVGAYNHKNGLGAAAGVALLILFYAILTSSGPLRLGFLAGFALAAVVLVGSKSATSLVVAIIGLALASGFQLWRRAPGVALTTLLAILLFLPIAALLISQQDVVSAFFDALEKDMTVHGRTDIWRLVWPYITDRFWFGYGFGSFWQPGFPWVTQMEARLRYTPFYSHNGVVETWIAGGAVTVALAIAVYFGTLIKSAISALRETAPDASFAFVFLVCFALRNITESSLLQPNDFLWIIFVALVVSTSKSVIVRLKPTDEGQPR